MPTHSPHTMSCMEVWGGNHAVDQGVVMPGLDLWVHSAPHEGNEQGGDVHYLSSCGTGRISRVVLADVSGHGERVGRFARELRTLLRKFVNYLDQTRFVEALNRGILTDQTGRFATSIAMTYFSPSRRLDLVNAGHPRPLLRRAATGEWSVLEGPVSSMVGQGLVNLPLGVLAPTQYEQFGITLDEGDMVLCFTDALIEARRPDGAMLGEAGLLELVRSIEASDPDALVQKLLREVAAYRDGNPAEDDVTILLLRQHGRRTQAPFLRRLAASVRFLALLGRAAIPFGERPPIPWPELNKANVLGPFSRKAAMSWRGPGGG